MAVEVERSSRIPRPADQRQPRLLTTNLTTANPGEHRRRKKQSPVSVQVSDNTGHILCNLQAGDRRVPVDFIDLLDPIFVPLIGVVLVVAYLAGKSATSTRVSFRDDGSFSARPCVALARPGRAARLVARCWSVLPVIRGVGTGARRQLPGKGRLSSDQR